jgi:hypothetical protein
MWDVSSVTTIDSMFRRAGVFNQDLSAWCFDESVDHDDYDDLAISWTEPRPQFGECAAAGGAGGGGGGGGGSSDTTTIPDSTVVNVIATLPPIMANSVGGSLPRTGTTMVPWWVIGTAFGGGAILLATRRRLRG